MSSNFSQVSPKLSLPVKRRPKPFSPSRKSVPLSICLFRVYIFPVVLSLNLLPIFSTTSSPLTVWDTNQSTKSGPIRIAFFSGSARSSLMTLRQWGHWINSLASRPILLSLNFSSQCGHEALKSNISFPFYKMEKEVAFFWIHSLFGCWLSLVFHKRQEHGFHAVWLDKHWMESVLCSQNDDAGVGTFNCKHFSTFYVFEHVTCFYHGISSLGNSGWVGMMVASCRKIFDKWKNPNHVFNNRPFKVEPFLLWFSPLHSPHRRATPLWPAETMAKNPSHQNTFPRGIRGLVFGGLLFLKDEWSDFLLGASFDFSL